MAVEHWTLSFHFVLSIIHTEAGAPEQSLLFDVVVITPTRWGVVTPPHQPVSSSTDGISGYLLFSFLTKLSLMLSGRCRECFSQAGSVLWWKLHYYEEYNYCHIYLNAPNPPTPPWVSLSVTVREPWLNPNFEANSDLFRSTAVVMFDLRGGGGPFRPASWVSEVPKQFKELQPVSSWLFTVCGRRLGHGGLWVALFVGTRILPTSMRCSTVK